MEDLSRELQAIERMLSITGKFNLQTEVIHATLCVMKDNPSMSIEEAVEKSMLFFKNLIVIEP